MEDIYYIEDDPDIANMVKEYLCPAYFTILPNEIKCYLKIKLCFVLMSAPKM